MPWPLVFRCSPAQTLCETSLPPGYRWKSLFGNALESGVASPAAGLAPPAETGMRTEFPLASSTVADVGTSCYLRQPFLSVELSRFSPNAATTTLVSTLLHNTKERHCLSTNKIHSFVYFNLRQFC